MAPSSPSASSMIQPCPACGAEMKVIAFITNYEVIGRIIRHLGVTFTYERPPPPPQQEELY